MLKRRTIFNYSTQLKYGTYCKLDRKRLFLEQLSYFKTTKTQNNIKKS